MGVPVDDFWRTKALMNVFGYGRCERVVVYIHMVMCGTAMLVFCARMYVRTHAHMTSTCKMKMRNFMLCIFYMPVFFPRGAVALWNGGNISFEGTMEFANNVASNDNGGRPNNCTTNVSNLRVSM